MTDPTQTLTEILEAHQPAGPREANDLDRMKRFATELEEPYRRSTLPGHFTASALVATPQLDHVILLHHRQLDQWLQCGGHAEPNETNPRTIALREAREETGLSPLDPHPLRPTLLDVDIHHIPAADTMPEHLHLDLRYLVQAPPHDEPQAPDAEAHSVQWFPLETARRELDLDEGLQRLLWKTRSLRIDAGYEADDVAQSNA